MKRTKKQKGFILLLVIALIPLLGMAAVVLTSNSRQILANTRRTAIRTHAQLACESGIAFLKANPQNVPGPNRPLVLEIDDAEKIINCTIEFVSETTEQSEFKITGHANDKRFSYDHVQPFALKH